MKRFDEQLLRVRMPSALSGMLAEGRLVHSLNIEGEAGTGRTLLALALAGAILCQRQQGPMCGECLQCRKVMAGAHSDIILADGSGESFRKKNIRALRAEAYRKPSEGRAKVYILTDAQNLDREVQNVLLKIMEEPPEDTFFIFTCDNRYRLLPTILSRMVTVSTRAPGREEVLTALEREFPGKGEEERARAVTLAGGSPGVAREILTDPAAARKYAAAAATLEALAARDACGVMTALAPWEKKREEYASLLEIVERLVMDPQMNRQFSLGTARGIRLREELDRLRELCGANGYPPLLSALLAEKGRRL